jgi:radical SAM-linked protein
MTQTETEKSLVRIRLHSARGEALRYVSHLDMQLVWERTLRRAKIAMAHSQGFNPRPRMHMASALPLGMLSRCELTDFWMEQPGASLPDLEGLRQRIQAAAPPGLEITQAAQIALDQPALQTPVRAAEYTARPLDALDAEQITQEAGRLLEASTLPRERRGKAYDLRPLIYALEVRPGMNGAPEIFMRLSAKESATGRPEEVLSALGLDATACRVERTALLLDEPAETQAG